MNIQEKVTSNEYLLQAKIDNVKNICNILKALNFSEDVIFFCSKDGLKLTVQIAKCVQASAFLNSEMFQEYKFQDDSDDESEDNDGEKEGKNHMLQVDFHTLLESLNMFEASGMNATVDLRIQRYDQPILLLLEEGGVILDCSIKTQVPGQVIDFTFVDDKPNKVIIKSEFLKDILDELDSSSSFVTIELSPDPPYFRISTSSQLGIVDCEVHRESDRFDYFSCDSSTAFKYKFDHLKHLIKITALSKIVSLRMDDRGLLCFQCMLKMEDGDFCFIEFFCIPSTNEDDDED